MLLHGPLLTKIADPKQSLATSKLRGIFVLGVLRFPFSTNEKVDKREGYCKAKTGEDVGDPVHIGKDAPEGSSGDKSKHDDI